MQILPSTHGGPPSNGPPSCKAPRQPTIYVTEGSALNIDGSRSVDCIKHFGPFFIFEL